MAEVGNRRRPFRFGQLFLSPSVDLRDLDLIPLPTADRAAQPRSPELRPPVAWAFTQFGIAPPDLPREMEKVN